PSLVVIAKSRFVELSFNIFLSVSIKILPSTSSEDRLLTNLEQILTAFNKFLTFIATFNLTSLS
ncbi:MAG: hypothetical protein WCI37_03545, partial [bacterium]